MIQVGNFKAAILAHSVNPVADEAISFELSYERFIHAEVMTHRSFCRNASSSRAIPYRRMVDWILRDPALPLHLGRNKPGMQSGAEVEEPTRCVFDLMGHLKAVEATCNGLVEGHDLHKEIVNRYLEPFGWINVVATMSRPALMNFFRLRMDAYAHPNIQRLAVQMARLYRASRPQALRPGEWHLPYVSAAELASLPRAIACIEDVAEVYRPYLVWSVARCAWCSYKTVEGKEATWEQAEKRHNDCVRLRHMTPCEHQLRARGDHLCNGGPVRGFDQYRHMIPGESCGDFDYAALLDGPYRDRDYLIPEPN